MSDLVLLLDFFPLSSYLNSIDPCGRSEPPLIPLDDAGMPASVVYYSDDVAFHELLYQVYRSGVFSLSTWCGLSFESIL
jgi:hypothetical protein